ncbi:YbjN domain-containing protein [Oxynema aestuarii]|uniref:YbjN domain-containing protein n=1 Tax=Oxynema aestuarii TaxID=2874213 RepID=UPI001FE485DA|nr:YbjN domain-containing protein [Oxynema aestuarii]
MATTLTQIAHFLDRRSWFYHLEPERNRIVTGVKSEVVENFMIVIQLHEGGEYLELCAPQLLFLKDHVCKGVAFQTMLAIAWEVKLLRWEYDPDDGEVRTSVALALEDAPLSENQFNRLLSALIQLTDRAIERLNTVLVTGEDPGFQPLSTQIA